MTINTICAWKALVSTYTRSADMVGMSNNCVHSVLLFKTSSAAQHTIMSVSKL